MANWLRRTLVFARFTFVEYLRTGRILAELLAVVFVLAVPLYPKGVEGVSAAQFFTIGGFFALIQASYTSFSVMRLGKRPEGFVILARSLGRGGYLIGLYLTALSINFIIYLLVSLGTVGLGMVKRQAPGFALEDWVYGSIPLMLDTAMLGAFFVLISSLVSTIWMRLGILGLVAFALSKDFLVALKIDFGPGFQFVQTLSSTLLVPLLGGFGLAIQQFNDQTALWIIAGQASLTLVLLVVSLVIFKRRNLMG